ncbi:hypothetical protein KO493_06920 [Tamlana agarivorans]|uniref:Uncharacterized protein n=1 Tax=Pseudotamlana agarivorans TaxID=481183 RepID=A0ACC5U7V7_9FLAO|nr:hypothetical protein [Tamlana agarivorans]MBU2950422.1 hypothetical protein [Tamlana agarivorans]
MQAWLLKYDVFYKDLKYNWQCPTLNCQYKFTGCCSCEAKQETFIFLSLYQKLLEFSYYHKYEAYVLNELHVYNSIKNDKSQVRSWVVKNEKIAGNACFEFLMTYHAYNDAPIELLVVGDGLLGFEVFIDHKDFISLIQFLQTFDELFWIQKIYPESEILDVFE